MFNPTAVVIDASVNELRKGVRRATMRELLFDAIRKLGRSRPHKHRAVTGLANPFSSGLAKQQ